jgi:hypothetical protein
MYYVSVDGSNSLLYNLLLGTVQSSNLGPVLYAMFVSPLFDVKYFFAFEDNTFIPRNGLTQNDVTKEGKSQSGLPLNPILKLMKTNRSLLIQQK